MREQRDILHEELADALGIDCHTITTYETDKRFPEPDTLQRIADYSGGSVDYLLEMVDDPTPPGRAVPTESGHREDEYDDELPEEAKKELEIIKDYLRHKYRKR